MPWSDLASLAKGAVVGLGRYGREVWRAVVHPDLLRESHEIEVGRQREKLNQDKLETIIKAAEAYEAVQRVGGVAEVKKLLGQGGPEKGN